jgi:hypothetical protein
MIVGCIPYLLPTKTIAKQSQFSHMGGSSSRNLEAASKEVRRTADDIIKAGIEDLYSADSRVICDHLRFTYRNKLRRLGKDLLSKTAYDLGLEIDPKVNKEEICEAVMEFYGDKVSMASYIIDHLETGCRDQHRVIVRNFDSILESRGPDKAGKSHQSHHILLSECKRTAQADAGRHLAKRDA